MILMRILCIATSGRPLEIRRYTLLCRFHLPLPPSPVPIVDTESTRVKKIKRTNHTNDPFDDVQVRRACKSYTSKYAGFVQGVPSKRRKQLYAVCTYNLKFRISLNKKKKLKELKLLHF